MHHAEDKLRNLFGAKLVLNLLISLAGSATLAAAQSYAWLDVH
jgi:hypothetical protein